MTLATSDVERAREVLAGLESKLSGALDRRCKTAHEISRACAAAETIIGINAARNSLGPLNKRAVAIDNEMALIRIEISHARRALELATAHAENVKAKANANAGATADKWFEISCPDGRKIRRRGASLESVQVGLQQGYRVVGRVFGANEDGTGGIVSSPGAPSMLKALLESQGDELLAFLADHGIVGSDKQAVVVLPTNNRESVQ
jgi:hypothetical protein